MCRSERDQLRYHDGKMGSRERLKSCHHSVVAQAAPSSPHDPHSSACLREQKTRASWQLSQCWNVDFVYDEGAAELLPYRPLGLRHWCLVSGFSAAALLSTIFNQAEVEGRLCWFAVLISSDVGIRDA